MSDKIYHFLSSSAREQYAEDIIRVLALPYGAELRFRYSYSIVDSDVLIDIREGQMAGKACIISFLDPGNPGDQVKIIPCRKGNVVQAGCFGAFVVIVFRVEGFLFHGQKELLLSSRTTIPNWKRLEGECQLTGYWAFSNPSVNDNPKQEYEFKYFTKTVKELSSRFPFNDVNKSKSEKAGLNPFYHVLFLEGDKEVLHASFSSAGLKESVRLSDGELTLSPGKRYYMRIHHYCPRSESHAQRGQRNVVIDLGGVAPQHTNVSRLRISSDYDVKDLAFKVLSSPFSARRTISVSIEGVPPSDATRGGYGDIEIPVLVPRAKMRSGITATLIGIGISLPAITGAAVEQDVSCLKIVLMLVGGLLTGLAAVYGLRVGI